MQPSDLDGAWIEDVDGLVKTWAKCLVLISSFIFCVVHRGLSLHLSEFGVLLNRVGLLL